MRSAMNASRHAGSSPATSRVQQPGAGSDPRSRGTGSGDRRRWTCPARRRIRRPRTPPPPGSPRHPTADTTHAKIQRPDQRVAGVHRRPPRGRPHHLPGRVVLGRLLRPRSRQHGGGVVAPESGSESRIEVIVGPTQPPTTDTRPGPDHPCGQRVAAPRVCTESGPRPVPWGGSRPGWGGSRRSLRDLLNRAARTRPQQEPQPAHRRQPDSQPAFGPRRGCQPAPPTPTKAPRLDSPGEGQTLR